MTKAELVSAVAKKTGLTAKDAKSAVDGTLDVIQSTLKKGDSVTLTGFGTFGARRRAARKARNPRTGEAIKVKAVTVPFFKAGATLKSTVERAKVAK